MGKAKSVGAKCFVVAVALAALALGALPAGAQTSAAQPGAQAAAQPAAPADPFGGRFGAFEIAPAPAVAAQLAALMGEALAQLQPQQPGQTDVYLIVASLWGDPVFEREATQAEEILRAHLNAVGRSIVLSAGAGVGAERRYPAATPDNIAAALGRVGQLIDANEDLVVVFLTSHGSPDGAMAMRELNRVGGALRPVHLRDTLAQAGIRNRVVIISACFSGAFIGPLADERTIVVTAAAPDRSSFGCQPERDWTYFGDAYFNHALRNGASLIGGFDQAKTMIEGWERDQHLSPPSNPQRYVGARAAAMLEGVERENR